MRKTKEELDFIKKQYGVGVLWSFSKVNLWMNDKYEYLLRYLKNIKEDHAVSIYGSAGNAAHECLEKFYTNEISYEDMYKQWTDKKDEFELLELKFNKSDEDKNAKIQNNYYDSLSHFFKNHNIVNKKNVIEYFLIITVGQHIFQGYIDMLSVEKIDGKVYVDIIDFKTSTLYTGKKIIQEERQLMLYALGVSQKLNIPLSRITAKWNFLKYVQCNVHKKGKKPKRDEILPVEYKKRYLKRNEIGISLASDIKMWAKTFGYSEDEISNFVQEAIVLNSIDNLPDDIKSKFEFEDAYVDIEISNDKINTLINELSSTIKEIEDYTTQWNETKDDSIFEYEVTKDNEFRLLTLCGYSRKYHIPMDNYLKQKELEELNKNKVVTGAHGETDNDIEDWIKGL